MLYTKDYYNFLKHVSNSILEAIVMASSMARLILLTLTIKIQVVRTLTLQARFDAAMTKKQQILESIS